MEQKLDRHEVLFMVFLAVAFLGFLHNPFHHKHQPPVVLTMESDIPEGQFSRVEEYIVAYQNVRKSLPNFINDEKLAELEVAEIAAVQADLDAMSTVTDPVHDPRLPEMAEKLAKDTTALVVLDDSLQELAYVSYSKRRKEGF